jgi:hypothetical protein
MKYKNWQVEVNVNQQIRVFVLPLVCNATLSFFELKSISFFIVFYSIHLPFADLFCENANAKDCVKVSVTSVTS